MPFPCGAVKNDCNLEVDGSMHTDVHGDYTLNVAGDVKVAAGGKIQAKSKGPLRVEGLAIDAISKTSLRAQAGTTMGFKASSVMFFETAAAFVIKAASAAVDGVFKQKNLSISAISPSIASIAAKLLAGTAIGPSVPAVVASKTPSEPSFSNLGFALTSAQIKAFKIEAFKAQAAANDKKMEPAGRQVAQEYADLKNDELTTSAVVSAPVIPNASATANTPTDYLCSVGLRVVEFATKDLGVLETNTPPGKNYGGKAGGGQLPTGEFGRIDEMLADSGLDNQAEVRRKGEGYYWCAAAVTSWWKSAGLPVPEGSASCRNWESWGRKKGYFSDTPKVGAAVLYGTSGAAHHIGIVSSVDDEGVITTIEGNTSGGAFNRNGCGVFHKTPRSYIGFIIPPPCA